MIRKDSWQSFNKKYFYIHIFFRIESSSFNSYPLIVKSRTESVIVLISSYEYDAEIVQVPYKIEFIAVENGNLFRNNRLI